MVPQPSAGDPLGRGARGWIALVGAGPGDPGLITVRGAELLGLADVVVYDQLVNTRLLDRVNPSAIRIYAGKSRGVCAYSQEEINGLLVDHANKGRLVVRLKGGDPYLFGRGAEEAEAARAAGVRFEVVPGVTAGTGAGTYAGFTVTHRRRASAVAFVTGHGRDAEERLDWQALARFPGTLVLYMGVRKLREHCDALLSHGKPPETPAAIVQSGSLPSQRTLTAELGSIADRALEAGIESPSLFILGEVVTLRDALRWYEDLPLFGTRVLVTRPAGEFESSARSIEVLGGEAIRAPAVAIEPITDWSSVDAAIARIKTFDWVVFTSSNGVRSFLDRLARLGLDVRALGSARLAAIGPTTESALADYRLKADLVPSEYRSEALADELAAQVEGRHVLLARADRGRDVLREQLASGGRATVEQIAVYRNVDAPAWDESVARRLAEGSVDWITLTSSAIARRTLELLPPEARARIGTDLRIATISPVTTEAVRALGFPVSAEARDYTWRGLIEAMIEVEGKRRGEGTPKTDQRNSR